MNEARRGSVERLAAFPMQLADVTRASVDRSVPDGAWSPAEVVCHLIAVETEVWAARLAQVATADEPHWSWTEPGPAAGYDGMPLPAIVAAFASARAATVATVLALDDAGWDRTGVHATFGRLDVAGLLRLAVDHDSAHLDGL
jgi:hypothetical protein